MYLLQLVKRRSFLILLLLTVSWGGLIARLWWLQLGFVHHYSARDIDLIKNAVRQRQQTIILDSGRGEIRDRNGYPFTGGKTLTLVLFPLARTGMTDASATRKLASLIDWPQAKLDEAIRKVKDPLALRDERGKLVALSTRQAEEINKLQLPGVLALPVVERYRPDVTAKQVIGFVGQNPELVKQLYPSELRSGKMSLDSGIGASGLERSFERFLQQIEPVRLSYFLDGTGRPLRGLDMRFKQSENSYYPLSLTTTLDAKIQAKLEQAADRAGLKQGSIVVLDAGSGDVVAMVSRPVYDQSKVDIAAGDWQNRAVKQLPPGSVFKIVVAAAALEEGVAAPTEKFQCTGEYGKYGFSCWNKEGHGSITMEEAFAQSCNIAFAEIAKRLGGAKIEEYARRLGLTVPVGWTTNELYQLKNFRQIDAEESGTVFAPGAPREDEGALIQTAIGQRDVRLTPLQAANLMVTILRGGQPGQVRLVRDITYQNGVTFHHFSAQPLAGQGISRITAWKLRRFLEQVVQRGTGKSLGSLPWKTAGKSGTAQVTVQGQQRDHQWFVGYAPVDKPRYAIAVVAENQPTRGAHQGTAVFSSVVETLASLRE
ncbi:peptidoglycan D,D-transpeptidase FtsI family protein [Brevibacillus massiliensis]|uniref:peptidoglycan D,D-transpeptidase FtsI family protein n=1 Tax=Brevibacillus massiliensis TaxID=1118054 RepID=UPI0002F7F819|nr:penicillin-binding transpeptidase domain-containing protein [Brevibacillus massiliensis]